MNVVETRDSSQVVKVNDFVSAVANDNAPVHALRPGFLSTFALATDQGSKLGLSKNKSIICYYNSYQVRHYLGNVWHVVTLYTIVMKRKCI